MATITKFWRRIMIVNDEGGNFVEMSGWAHNVVRDDDGEVVNEFETPAEVITTDSDRVPKILGEALIGANTALDTERKAKAGLADLHATLQRHADQVTAERDEARLDREGLSAEVKRLNDTIRAGRADGSRKPS